MQGLLSKKQQNMLKQLRHEYFEQKDSNSRANELFKDTVERAIALGFNDYFLDDDHCICLKDYGVLFLLDKYVSLLDSSERIVEIPEGVTHVKMFGGSRYNANGYLFVFPSTLQCLFSFYGNNTNYSVSMALCEADHNFGECLSNSLLDFTRCSQITTIRRNAFASYMMNTLLFNKSVQTIEPHAFDNVDILHLSLPGVDSMEDDTVFHEANIRSLDMKGANNGKEKHVKRVKNGKFCRIAWFA